MCLVAAELDASVLDQEGKKSAQEMEGEIRQIVGEEAYLADTRNREYNITPGTIKS